MDIIRKPIVRFVIAVLAVFAAGAGGVAYAAHQFPDVPSAGFHDQIGAITDAGCATGFNDGTFQPQSGTTRGQFAFWMNNCGGRVAHQFGLADFPDANQQTIVETSIKAGAAGSGGGYALVQLNVQGQGSCINGAGCQVQVQLQHKRTTDVNWSNQRSVVLDFFPNGPAANHQPNGSTANVISLQAGTEMQVRAVGLLQAGGSDNPRIYGDITAMSFPFNGQGQGNPIP